MNYDVRGSMKIYDTMKHGDVISRFLVGTDTEQIYKIVLFCVSCHV